MLCPVADRDCAALRERRARGAHQISRSPKAHALPQHSSARVGAADPAALNHFSGLVRAAAVAAPAMAAPAPAMVAVAPAMRVAAPAMGVAAPAMVAVAL